MILGLHLMSHAQEPTPSKHFSNASTLEYRTIFTLQSGVIADNFLESNEQVDAISRGVPILFAVELKGRNNLLKSLDVPEYYSIGLYVSRVAFNFRTQGTNSSKYNSWQGGLRATVSLAQLLNDRDIAKHIILKGGDIYAGFQAGYQVVLGIESIISSLAQQRVSVFPLIGVEIDLGSHTGTILEVGKSAQSFVNFGFRFHL